MTEAERARLSGWLATLYGPGTTVADLSRLSGGAIQENWALALNHPDGRVEHLVLRRDAGAQVAASHGRDAEFRLLRAAFSAGVKVAEPLHLCTDSAVLGGPFFLMRRLGGIADPRRLVRDDAATPDREALGHALGAELARIHAIRPPRPDLGFLPPPSHPPLAARLARLRAYLDDLPHPQPALEWALRWLTCHAPEPHGPVLIHGDYRTGNIMIDSGRISGVLDWEFAAWGDPMEDIGWFCARCWRFGADAREAGGLASRVAFLRGYESVAGWAVAEAALPYWQIMATARWAIIALQQGTRHATEAMPTLEPALTGRLAPQLVHETLHLIEAAPHA